MSFVFFSCVASNFFQVVKKNSVFKKNEVKLCFEIDVMYPLEAETLRGIFLGLIQKKEKSRIEIPSKRRYTSVISILSDFVHKID